MDCSWKGKGRGGIIIQFKDELRVRQARGQRGHVPGRCAVDAHPRGRERGPEAEIHLPDAAGRPRGRHRAAEGVGPLGAARDLPVLRPGDRHRGRQQLRLRQLRQRLRHLLAGGRPRRRELPPPRQQGVDLAVSERDRLLHGAPRGRGLPAGPAPPLAGLSAAAADRARAGLVDGLLPARHARPGLGDPQVPLRLPHPALLYFPQLVRHRGLIDDRVCRMIAKRRAGICISNMGKWGDMGQRSDSGIPNLNQGLLISISNQHALKLRPSLYPIPNRHYILVFALQMSSKAERSQDKAERSQDNSNSSILSLLEALDSAEPHTSSKNSKASRKTIDLNASQPFKPHPKQESTAARNKERLVPVFESRPVDFNHKRLATRQMHHGMPVETQEKREKHHAPKQQPVRQVRDFKEPNRPQKPLYSLPFKDQFKEWPRQLPKAKQKHHHFQAQAKPQTFPITFQQSIVYEGVNIAICFGDYKMHETDITSNVALVVPFTNLDCHTNLISDVWKRTKANLRSMLEDQLENSKQSNFRTGEVFILSLLEIVPYSRIYFMKTPNSEGLVNYLLDRLLQSIKKLVERAESDSIKRIVFGEWMWGALEPDQAATMTFKAIIEGVKNLGVVKGLESVRLCINKKLDYQVYAKAFREMSDQYLEAFYRE